MTTNHYILAPIAQGVICQPLEAEAYALYAEALGDDANLTLLLQSDDPEAVWALLDERVSADETAGHTPKVSYCDKLHGSVDAGPPITFANGNIASLIFRLWDTLTHMICDDLPDSDDPDYRDDDFDNHVLAPIRDAGSLIANGLT